MKPSTPLQSLIYLLLLDEAIDYKVDRSNRCLSKSGNNLSGTDVVPGQWCLITPILKPESFTIRKLI